MSGKNSSYIPALRLKKREQRRCLSSVEQGQHATQLAHHITRHPRFLRCQRIACYLANDGEIDPIYIIEQAWLRGKQVYLPVLQPLKNNQKNKLRFAPFKLESSMCINKYGIQEPVAHPNQTLGAQQIDLMLLPLVAFDANNNRLGMGGGYYDRSLAYLSNRQYNRKPYLIGLAHELQKTDQLPVGKWDVRMDAIVTEEKIYNNRLEA
jgi:5-formyltetrahydrofolate cyclo-ligase